MNIKQRIIGTRGKQKGKTMDDLISRQAAIDAIEHRLAEPAYQHTGEDWYVGMNCAESELYELPSAQPEPHWIPVTENYDCDLMDNEEVLVFEKDGTINGQIRHAVFYDFNGKKKFVTWEEGITIYNVLAYMPLPEPYKEVTE